MTTEPMGPDVPARVPAEFFEMQRTARVHERPEFVMPGDDNCALCKNPATGYATIGDDRYCHGDLDPEPTCYQVAQWRMSGHPFVGAVPADPAGFDW